MIQASIYDGFSVTDKVISVPVIFDVPVYNGQRFYLKSTPNFLSRCAITKIAINTADVTINSLVSTSFSLTLVDNKKQAILNRYPVIDLVNSSPGAVSGNNGKHREFDLRNIDINASYVLFFAPVGAPPEVVNFRILFYYSELLR